MNYFLSVKDITIHDADDISLPERFKRQLSFLNNNNEYVMVGCNYFTISEKGSIINKSNLIGDSDVLKKLNNRSQFHGPTVIFKKHSLEKLDMISRPFFKDYNED